MNHEFDKDYWDAHWSNGHQPALPPHPALDTELANLRPGMALEAGSGEGAEAIWLAAHGWDVTAVDISARALGRAAARSTSSLGTDAVKWVEADLTAWEPVRQFDLVTTFYAHPTMPQHEFYERISNWVAPGGTLLIVGHLHDGGHGHGHAHPENAVTGPDQIRALLEPRGWNVRTAEVRERSIRMGDRTVTLHDVVARAEKAG